MKKIGLITLHKNNFGSILQCYSVKRYIESLGYECAVIEIFGRKYLFEMRIELILDLIITFFDSPKDFFRFFKLRKSGKIENSFLSSATKNAMNNFVKKELAPQQYSISELRKIGRNKEFIAFIAGSDQIWNCSRKVSGFYFLDFAPSYKKIAVAPSFGISDIPRRYKKNLKKNLNSFHNLSVREETGVRIISDLTGKSAIRLADPTLINNKNEWEKISETEIVTEQYIFLHFLSEPSLSAKKLIRDFVTDFSIKFILFGYKCDFFDSLDNIQFVDGGPLDYIKYISNSKYVFTDSYHTTLFSINLKKQFLTFDRNHLHQYTQKSRIVDLLKRYELIDRFIEQEFDFNDKKEIKEWKSEKKLESDRILIREYIKNEIERIKELESCRETNC